ncbi:methyltransferase [Pandoraea sp. PE-S2T-3]|uniref:methyltransferase n=1 Tax=Pandoraea sp. PE-S2T-3 TaxID=1986993 RepID=UPI000B403034|nr:methyltransferase [Pandoraea sp. PE-S2T-3]
MSINPAQKLKLENFNYWLGCHGFLDECLQQQTQNAQEIFWTNNLPYFPSSLRASVEIFSLGLAIESETLRRIYPIEIIECLINLEILCESGGRIQANGFTLVPNFGSPIFCDSKNVYRDYYYGTDSMMLGQLVRMSGARVLDMCSGIGSQAILAAKLSNQVISVELQPSVRRVFQLNVAMNSLDNRIERFEGDLFSPLAGETFDYIICNPPFLPVPPEIQLRSIAHGGEDGLSLMERLLIEGSSHLSEQGRIVAVGMVLGDESTPRLNAIRQAASTRHLNIHITLQFKAPLTANTRITAALRSMCAPSQQATKRETTDAYDHHFEKLAATHLYSFTLTARKADCSGVVCVTRAHHSPYQLEFPDRQVA